MSMIKSSISVVITLVSTNSKSYQKYCSLVENILSINNIMIDETENLAPFVKDYFFYCTENIFFNMGNVFKNDQFKKIDICLQKNRNRRKKIIACDMDMTAINVETVDMIGKKILKNTNLQDLTKKTMQGKINFKESILLRTKMLAGINVNDIISLIPKIEINSGIANVIRTMNSYGNHTMLISGGYNVLADQIGKKIGFKEIISNKLKLQNNLLTGDIYEEVIDRDAKLKYLKERIQKNNLNSQESIAIGDGANDIDMIKYADLGIAYKAYPTVEKVANVVINNNIRSVLYFQGYKDNEMSII